MPYPFISNNWEEIVHGIPSNTFLTLGSLWLLGSPSKRTLVIYRDLEIDECSRLVGYTGPFVFWHEHISLMQPITKVVCIGSAYPYTPIPMLVPIPIPILIHLFPSMDP